MWSFPTVAVALLAAATCGVTQQTAGNFTIVNGQVYTPGLAILDSPQPNTPEGGDYLQVAIDVSGDGRLSNQQPWANSGVETGLFNITLFLTSYAFGLNFTISNGTSFGWLRGTDQPTAFQCPAVEFNNFQNAGCQEVLTQESGSTVKHVNWVWPDCFVGNGGVGSCSTSPSNEPSCLQGNARGAYNVRSIGSSPYVKPANGRQMSIHQSFRLNGTNYYTIFDLPISVTNSIPTQTQQSSNGRRPLCRLLNNPLLPPSEEFAGTSILPYQPYLGGGVSTTGPSNSNGQGEKVSGTISLEANWLTLWAILGAAVLGLKMF